MTLFAILAYAVMLMLGISGLRATVGEVTPGSIADRAGLDSGYQIVAVADREVATWESAIQAILNQSLDRRPVARRSAACSWTSHRFRSTT